MKRALPFAVALMAVGLAGMTLRGPAVAGVTVEAEPDTTGSMSIRLDRHEPPPDWLPTPVPGRELLPGESWKAYPVAALRAMNEFPDEAQWTMNMIAFCESRWRSDVTGTDGAGSFGAFQVIARYHGPVPADLEGQARQAEQIREKHGYVPWSTYPEGCEEWRR